MGPRPGISTGVVGPSVQIRALSADARPEKRLMKLRAGPRSPSSSSSWREPPPEAPIIPSGARRTSRQRTPPPGALIRALGNSHTGARPGCRGGAHIARRCVCGGPATGALASDSRCTYSPPRRGGRARRERCFGAKRETAHSARRATAALFQFLCTGGCFRRFLSNASGGARPGRASSGAGATWRGGSGFHQGRGWEHHREEAPASHQRSQWRIQCV